MFVASEKDETQCSPFQIQNYYTWNDRVYRDYMINMLQHLEPIMHEASTIIISELDEFGEISFIDKGTIGIGYEINKVTKYCITMKDKAVIGAYGCTFNQRAAFIYTAINACEGFFVRKRQW
jgi:hypothetical protein